MTNDSTKIKGRVVAVLTRPDGSRRVLETTNIVTDAGDVYYAQRGVNETPTNFTSGATWDGVMELATDTGTPLKTDNRSNVSGLVSGSQKTMETGYPKTNDPDVDNTGSEVDAVTYKAIYASGVATATGIASVIITNPSPGASEPLLSYALFAAPFDKAAGDSLTVYVNHGMNGV